MAKSSSLDCDCVLLNMLGMDELSPWSDFSPDRNGNGQNTAKSACSATFQRRPKMPDASLFGSVGAKQAPKFEHHENYHTFIEEYRRAQQNTKKSRHKNQAVVTTPYNVTYNLRVPDHVDKPKGGILVKQQTTERENSCQVESMEKFLASCYYLQPRLPTASGKKSLLTYSDIKDYVINENKDEVNSKLLKPRKLEINLTGKFVKRVHSSKSIPSAKVRVSSKRQPLEQFRLSPPQKPLMTCSYKLPASFPSRMSSKSASHSARLRTEKMLPYPTAMQLMNHSENSKNSPSADNWTSQLTDTAFNEPVRKRLPANTNSKLEPNRKKQLQQLVEILGETTLTPYLRKLSVGQSNARQPAINTDAIDYSVVFGSRI